MGRDDGLFGVSDDLIARPAIQQIIFHVQIVGIQPKNHVIFSK